MKTKFIPFDFEYNDRQVILCKAKREGEIHTFDLRNGQDIELLRSFINDSTNYIFLSYALNAEINSLRRLGICTKNMKCIDVMAECRMVTLSHTKYFCGGSMLDQVRSLLKVNVAETTKTKNYMRDLIIDNDRWSGYQWSLILAYCESDLKYLAKLMTKCAAIHRHEKHSYKLKDMLRRGSYVRKCAEMDFASPGFPLYGNRLLDIYKHKSEAAKLDIESLSNRWLNCYKWNKKENRYSLVMKKLMAANEDIDWGLTDNGNFCLRREYLKELGNTYEAINEFRRSRNTQQRLSSGDISHLIVDGHMTTTTFAFAAKTSRNGLKPKRGFLFNLPGWLRKVVQPYPGTAMIGCDYSQQEVMIAATLSGDKALQDVYRSGDVYLAMGKKFGLIPLNGTKKSHGSVRDLVKVLQLGISYGKQVPSISKDFYKILKGQGKSFGDAQKSANEMFKFHKKTFKVYWAFAEGQIKEAQRKGWAETTDGWAVFCDNKTNKNSLLNFPTQSEAAVMLRRAVELYYDAWVAGELPPVMCSQHDAIYTLSKEGESEVISEKMSAILIEASKQTLGEVVNVDIDIYTVDHPYEPPRWSDQDEKIWNIFDTLIT